MAKVIRETKTECKIINERDRTDPKESKSENRDAGRPRGVEAFQKCRQNLYTQKPR